jgi:hypothetical protein
MDSGSVKDEENRQKDFKDSLILRCPTTPLGL